MNLNVSMNQPAFNAHFRLKNPNVKLLKDATLATSTAAAAAGALATAYGLVATVENPELVGFIPNEVIEPTRDFLLSANERRDAAGDTGGIPVQATAIPSTLVTGGVYSGFNAYEKFSELKNNRRLPS